VLKMLPCAMLRATLSVLLAVSVTVSTEAQAFSRSRPAEALTSTEAATETTEQAIGLSQLPRQGQDVYQRILAGGPFTYDKDGVVFGNRERLLPRQTRGFYREYTVPTPGARNRGARRIVCGGKVVRSPETCFYTQDHYQSFQKIDPQR
jgi:ribonuclease T1